jgi:catechol-2,3-dioxygenase
MLMTDDVIKAGAYDLVDERLDMLAHAVAVISEKLGLAAGAHDLTGAGAFHLAILFEASQAEDVALLINHLAHCLPEVAAAAKLAGDPVYRSMPDGRGCTYWPAVALKLKGH